MNATPDFEHESFARQHRGGMLLERHGIDLYLHPFLGFTLSPGLEIGWLTTDQEGFRVSDSPYGPVDSVGWSAAGGGGILLGNSVALGLAASSDAATVASQLAHLTGVRQLNLGLCAAVSLQEVIAAIPFLPSASTVVIIGGGPDLINLVGSMAAESCYGTVSYERTFDDLTRVPLFDLATLAAGRPLSELEDRRRPAARAPHWDLDQIDARMAVAARRRIRDLSVLARAAVDGTRILFCQQPLATGNTREYTPQERARYDFDAPIFGMLHSAVEAKWDDFGALIAAGCAEIGVAYLNLAADRFVGDSFSDTVHLTDGGYRQAAQLIWQALETATPIRSNAGQTNAGQTGTGKSGADQARGDQSDPGAAIRAERLRQLTEIVTQTLELQPGELSPTGDFVNHYGADSMLVIDILSRVEEDLGIRIPDAALPQMTHLEAVLALVELHAGDDADA